MTKSGTQVLVVGAGPTGLATALALTLEGVPCRVIDRLATGANTSRAAVVHARTLEVLQPLGAAELLVAQGLQAARFSIRDRDRVLVELGFGWMPSRYPYALTISQATTEAVLLSRLEAQGVKVERPRTLTRLENGADRVVAHFEDGDPITADWVVGADGMHSAVRESVAIPFEGAAYPESFVLADTVLHTPTPADEVILFLSSDGVLVLAPLPDGVHRIVATVADAPERPAQSDVQALLDARGPARDRAYAHAVLWSSRFRVHHRLAATYRAGRVLLAGDAAHVHSPAGGQGMNTGIQDGVALADALRAELGGDTAALSGYVTRRRQAAREVVGTADMLTRMATVPPAARPFRNALLGVVGRVPAVPRRFAWRLSGLAYR